MIASLRAQLGASEDRSDEIIATDLGEADH
jgi:hypothetical protein